MGKSLEFVKAGIKSGEIQVKVDKVSDFRETGEYVSKFFQDAYTKIWKNDNGLMCQAKNSDTNTTKKLTIKYDPKADFKCYVVATGYDIEDEKHPTLGYMKLMGQIISDIVWCKVYDKKIVGDHYLDDDNEDFWNYDENYSIGDFVLYKDSKDEYIGKPLMIEEINDLIKKNVDAQNNIVDADIKEEMIEKEIPKKVEEFGTKDENGDEIVPTRFIAILPISIVYKNNKEVTEDTTNG